MLSLKQGDRVGPWTVVKKIGEGAYGSVYSGKCEQSKNKEYALKVAPLNKKKKSFEASLIANEVQFLRIRLRAFSNNYDFLPRFPYQYSYKHITGDTEDGKIRYLAMEKLDMTLKDYCIQQGGRLGLSEIYSIAVQVLSIFQFFHSSFTIYNDIKPENFMLRKTPHGYQLVAIDFGAMKIKLKGKPTLSDGLCGTPLYMSVNNEKGGNLYCSDDLVALGYMLAALYLGELPWKNGRSNEEIVKMKQQQLLDGQLRSAPELLTFIHAFEFNTTDSINYSEWIDFFKKSPKFNSPYLPIQITSESLDVQQLDRKSVKRISSVGTENVSVQEIINQSPHSIIQKTQAQTSPSAGFVRAVSKRQQTKTFPVRKQPHRACKKIFGYCCLFNKYKTDNLARRCLCLITPCLSRVRLPEYGQLHIYYTNTFQ